MPEDRLNPAQRRLQAQCAAHILHSRYDSRELTAKARAKFLVRFLDEVDPNRSLPELERQRRAEHLRKAYFQALAAKSAAARKRRLGPSNNAT